MDGTAWFLGAREGVITCTFPTCIQMDSTTQCGLLGPEIPGTASPVEAAKLCLKSPLQIIDHNAETVYVLLQRKSWP